MMAKTVLGVDVGHDTLKLALVRSGAVLRTVSAPMPVNLLREGHVTSVEALGELIAQTLRKEKLRAGNAAVILSGEVSFLRTTAMPRMSGEQIATNVPYEFADYITGELKDYLFDYAVVPPLSAGEKKEQAEPPEPAEQTAPSEQEEEKSADRVPLLVSAVRADVMDEVRQTLRKAGLRLVSAAPAECAFLALIRACEARGATPDREYCFLDLGYRAIRMYIFHGPRYEATRVLEVGLSSLDEIIANAKGVDTHLAHTYLLNNFEDCQQQDYCKSAYDNIAVELMRALNFYRFSNSDSALDRVWLCGGGAEIAPLREAVAASLDLEVRIADELLQGGGLGRDGFVYTQAVGIAMSE